jgi:hypothetical protein
VKPTLVVALLLASASCVARAQEYGVSGHDAAGRARIDGPNVRVDMVSFAKGNTSTARTIHGHVVSRDASALRFTYDRLVEDRGIVDRLTFWRAPTYHGVPTTVVLTAQGSGWSGDLEGQAQSWVVQPAHADLAVLVVPGLSTNLWNQYGVPYLDENLAALRARGFSARRLAINTEESIAVNAAAIAREIRLEVAAGRRVLLMAHSKGGADAITALSDPANADLLPHVAGLMAIQPVYGGSPIADIVGQHTLIQATADAFFARVLPVINRETDTGSGAAVRDLRTDARQALLRAHPYPVDRIPTVVVRGSFEGRPFARPRHVLREPLWVFQRFLQVKYGLQSDGMVSLDKQRIPGARVEITLTDIDHFEPGFRGESPHSPCAITNRLLDATLPYLANPSGR